MKLKPFLVFVAVKEKVYQGFEINMYDMYGVLKRDNMLK